MASTYVPSIKKYYSPSIINHVLLSISLSTPIIVSSVVDRVFFDKNKLPYLPPKDIISLCLLTTMTTYTIDYLKTYDYIPQIISRYE